MSRITITEKDHWRRRIENRINAAISELEATEPGFQTDLQRRAELETHRSLGTDKLYEEIAQIDVQLKQLNSRHEALTDELYQTVYENFGGKKTQYYSRTFFTNHFEPLRERAENRLLQESELGKRILKLKQERESILDTVWLATSTTQIRGLWTNVLSVIGDESTDIQKKVLASKPIDA